MAVKTARNKGKNKKPKAKAAKPKAPKPKANDAPAAVAEPKPLPTHGTLKQPPKPVQEIDPQGDVPNNARLGSDPVPATTKAGSDFVMEQRKKMIEALCKTCKEHADFERWTTFDIERMACSECYRTLQKKGLL
jgi:hypothetical protein